MENAGSELQNDGDFVSDPACHLETRTGADKEEETSLIQQSRRPSLPSLQIPARSLESTPSSLANADSPLLSSPGSSRGGLPPRPNSAKPKSSMRSLLAQRSFKTKDNSQDCERTVLIVPDTLPSDGPVDQPSTSRSLSLNKVLLPSSRKATHSLPVTPTTNVGPEIVDGRPLSNVLDSSKMDVKKHMTRSFSVPVNIRNSSLRRTSSSSLIRVISARSRAATVEGASSDIAPRAEIVIEDAAEDIPEEEAVCRICFVELGEGGDTLKMECSCKGELALAHQACAVKWFSIKGNKTCDICKQDVRNLPVTLLKIHNSSRQPSNTVEHREVAYYRIWQLVPTLTLVSMLAYFCFLEQLLISDLGVRALAISLPFSCVLGLLSSMIASTMVSGSYIWAYACFQFAIIILFAHVFYSILNVSPILSVLLSSFTGFGIAISTNTLLVEYIRWRASRHLLSLNHDVYRTPQQQQQQPEQHHQQQRQQTEQHQ
ncbi:hypothetical protein L6164_028892 [Bauhinia variegata]|uniref:Uncharacterized protein n=1 Tax=Bauhinia variegata TaxID=167791 RepID=A0ACB9L7V4_BAUVA|nr:hypothetical protein L6164_028892 [Bauhinia variegata]